MRRGTDTQTHTQTLRRPWLIYISPRLCLTWNVTNLSISWCGVTAELMLFARAWCMMSRWRVNSTASGTHTHQQSLITFCTSRRWRKMYCGHVRLCVCLCVCPRPYAHTTDGLLWVTKQSLCVVQHLSIQAYTLAGWISHYCNYNRFLPLDTMLAWCMPSTCLFVCHKLVS